MSSGPYRVEQVAAILGVHPDTVRDWADRGLLACTRTAGGHRRFAAAAIEAFVAAMVSGHRRAA